LTWPLPELMLAFGDVSGNQAVRSTSTGLAAPFTSVVPSLSRQFHDSPYRDDGAKHSQSTSSTSHQHRRAASPASTSISRSPLARHEALETERSPRSRRRGGARRGKQGAKRGASHRPIQLTSHPTGRVAYAETRRWLLHQHGPVCAYCGERFAEATMTLDHVAPRRGQTAYDRRDNLVLACKTCNAAKRDLAPIAFLLARRSRATHLLRYGTHLSPMLVDLARSLAPEEEEESPYRD
jgi:5-methylcytosine-specific restriction endonuclease McrA